MRLVGFDPSLRHWGIAKVETDDQGVPTVLGLQVLEPVVHTGKQVRQNSQDLDAAEQLYTGALLAAKHAHAVFVEVPVGSQSAAAMKSYGVCIGVLAGLRAVGIPFFLVTADEVKLAGHGTKTATKKQMIEWAVARHPEANWPRYMRKGVQSISESQAEHMADALAAIYAGCRLQEFKRLRALTYPLQAAV